MNGRFLEIVRSTSGSRVVQGQDCLGRVWESEFWAENKKGAVRQGLAEVTKIGGLVFLTGETACVSSESSN